MRNNFILETIKSMAEQTVIQTINRIDDDSVIKKETNVKAHDMRINNIKHIATAKVEEAIIKKIGV